MLSTRLASAAAVLVAIVVGSAGPAGASAGLPLPTVVTTYKVVDVRTANNWVDFSRRVARCTAATPGTTCTISRALAVGTTVQAALGYSQSGVAGNLGFSLSRMSTTTVSCTSPKLRHGQSFLGYPEGTRKLYKIEKWQTSSSSNAPAPKLVAASGTLSGFQPFGYPAIYCRVENG
jgi:hypothetical protein